MTQEPVGRESENRETAGRNAIDLFPKIRRARGFRVYDTGGNRYLDLFQDGGRAILGHRPDRVGIALKNTISKGLLSDYPSVYENRFSRALQGLLPGHAEFRWYRSHERAIIAASEHLGRPLRQSDIADPAGPAPEGAEAAYWRPFHVQAGAEVNLPILPFPESWAAAVIAFRNRPGNSVPPSDTVSAVTLAGMCRSVYDLIKYTGEQDGAMWERFSCSLFHRSGPYLTLKCGAERFRAVFEAYLAHGVLLSPYYPGPSILPGEFSEGEIQRVMQYGELE